MSKTMTVYPILEAVRKADDIIGPNCIWQTIVPISPHEEKFFNQAQFLKIYNSYQNEQIPEIESIASCSAVELNAFVRKHGFSIQLGPFSQQNEFGTVSLLDVVAEWTNTGKVTTVQNNQKDYVAVKLGQDTANLFTVPIHPYPVACVDTKSFDAVYMTPLDEALEGFALLEQAHKISTYQGARPCQEYHGVIFPMVDLDQEVNISWIKGLSTRNPIAIGVPAIISQALQQTKFKMNEIGAHVKSAVAIGVKRGLAPSPYIIDKPFLVWIERRGLSQPLFAGYITPEDWKNPGSLAM